MAQPAIRQPALGRQRIARSAIPASRSGDRIHLTESSGNSVFKAKAQRIGLGNASGKPRPEQRLGVQRAALSDVSNRTAAARLPSSHTDHGPIKPTQKPSDSQNPKARAVKSTTRLREQSNRSSVQAISFSRSIPKAIASNYRLSGAPAAVSSMDLDVIANARAQQADHFDSELEQLQSLPASDSEDDGASLDGVEQQIAVVEQALDDHMSDLGSSSSSDDESPLLGAGMDGQHHQWLDTERSSAGTRPESVTSAEDSDNFDFHLDPEGIVTLHPELEEAARCKVAMIKARYDEQVLKPRTLRSQMQRNEAVARGQLPPELAAQDDELAIMGLDPEEVRDTSMVAEYSQEVFQYMGQCERETMANPNYMDFQSEIEWHMRAILIDWLLQVHMRYHMLPETLWIAINVVDRFLSVRVVSLAKLQLVGVTAMFIAAKYEEILAPSVKEFVHMTEGGYTKEEILKGERIILSTLDFNVSTYCSPYSWVRRISKADDYDIQTRTLSKFLMELALLDHRFLRAKPSLVAAVGMFLARKMLGGEWDDAFVYYSDFTEEQLVPGANLLLERLLDPAFEDQFVFRKYSHKKFLKCSIYARDWAYQNHKALMAAAAAQGLQ